jgi:pimeloyl-ACP methyl ester carboxylesterase
MPLLHTLSRALLPAHAPPLRLLVTEPWRALCEYVEHHRGTVDHLPRGDGHPVVIFPGLATDELAVRPLKRRLRQLGYDAVDWGRGWNTGPGKGEQMQAWIAALSRHVDSLVARRSRRRSEASRHGQVSLVGWSLGVLYAREVAKQLGKRVRRVITIGTPFNAISPDVTHAALVYRVLNGAPAPADDDLLARLREPPQQPTTSIYSRRDGIVAWHACTHDVAHDHVDEVELDSSHLGMGWNPKVIEFVAQRLAER